MQYLFEFMLYTNKYYCDTLLKKEVLCMNIQNIDYRKIDITNGFWKQKQDLNREVTIVCGNKAKIVKGVAHFTDFLFNFVS